MQSGVLRRADKSQVLNVDTSLGGTAGDVVDLHAGRKGLAQVPFVGHTVGTPATPAEAEKTVPFVIPTAGPHGTRRLEHGVPVEGQFAGEARKLVPG